MTDKPMTAEDYRALAYVLGGPIESCGPEKRDAMSACHRLADLLDRQAPDDVREARQYAEQLDAHMDEGGQYSTEVVRSLIRYIMKLTEPTALFTSPVGEDAREAVAQLLYGKFEQFSALTWEDAPKDLRDAWFKTTDRIMALWPRPDPDKVQVPREALRQILRDAYIKGAQDVHEALRSDPSYLNDPDPDFGEAGDDFAADAMINAAIPAIRRQVIEELAREAEEECAEQDVGVRGMRKPGERNSDYLARLFRAEWAAQWLRDRMPELCAENAQNPDQTSYRQTEINPASDMDSGQISPSGDAQNPDQTSLQNPQESPASNMQEVHNTPDAKDEVIEAARRVKADLIMRAEMDLAYVRAKQKDPEAIPTVAVGSGVWNELCGALSRLDGGTE